MTVREAIQTDLKQIAIGCLYLLTNKATLEFPTSSRAHPSYRVVVSLTPGSLFRSSDQIFFPFFVHWGLWHDAIAPVLMNKDVQVFVRDNPNLRVMPNFILLRNPLDVDTLIDKIADYLFESMIETGYLPPEPEADPDDPAEVFGPVEDVNTDGDPIGSPNAKTGVDSELFHPDGSPKLVYRSVD